MTQQQEGQVDLVARIYQGNRTEPGYSALVNTLPIEGRLGAGQAQFQLGPEAYVPSDSLVMAVQLAMYLRRPLLLEGDTGCGKSRLAFSVAWELGFPLFEYYVHSTARAKDLLYVYNALTRLYDIEISKHDKPIIEIQPSLNENTKRRDPGNPGDYIDFGPLGSAIRLSSQYQIPSVVLIDEIDKGDYDFPNDLLLELERLEFQVNETGEGFKAHENRLYKPLIIITSNREKALPRPFLRRCIYHFVEFPDEARLDNILQRRFQSLYDGLDGSFNLDGNKKWWEIAIRRFVELRARLRTHKPGTSELIDWIEVLIHHPADLQKLLSPLLHELPYLDLLIKNNDDRKSLKKNIE